MITLEKVRTLDVGHASVEGRPMHLSAASGLVRLGSAFYVIADDEHFLGVFRGHAPGHLIRLFEGDLPDGKKARKKQKPDLEALAILPPFGNYAHGALLALGSGSRHNRRLGAVLGIEADGAVRDVAQLVDLAVFFTPLEGTFPKLNIEGAVVSEGELRLFQRGNKKNSANAIIRFPLAEFLAGLELGRVRAIAPMRIDTVELGEIDGIPLCFTDAASLPDGAMIFTAVAENTDDSYADGPCLGAAIGIVSNDGTLAWVRRLAQPHKIEGVEVQSEGDRLELLLVTDADDAAEPASLYSAILQR